MSTMGSFANKQGHIMNNIERILSEVYGVGVAVAPKEAVLWAAEKIADKEQARKELKRANRIRAKFGKPVVYARWGSHAF